MSDYSELKRLAEAFPSDLDWDGNTEPFFNGPSGESLGGGATGFYCVYGKPFRLDGEDYDYDGQTYVEACHADFAKFMVSAREGVLGLIADNDRLQREQKNDAIAYKAAIEKQDELRIERDQLKAESEALRSALFQAQEAAKTLLSIEEKPKTKCKDYGHGGFWCGADDCWLRHEGKR